MSPIDPISPIGFLCGTLAHLKATIPLAFIFRCRCENQRPRREVLIGRRSMAQTPTPAELLWAELQAGHASSLADLFALFRPRLRQMVRLRMDPRIAARVDPSDVLQEAYLDAARQLGHYLKQP